MKIAVIGTGYVGLVTSTCLAESGNDVVGIDKDERKIAMLEAGRLPIYEPGLLELVQRNRREGRLHFTTDLAGALAPAQLAFIAVGTPQGADGSADLNNLWAVVDALGGTVASGQWPGTSHKTLVIKSTVPVGTNRAVAERLGLSVGDRAYINRSGTKARRLIADIKQRRRGAIVFRQFQQS